MELAFISALYYAVPGGMEMERERASATVHGPLLCAAGPAALGRHRLPPLHGAAGAGRVHF